MKWTISVIITAFLMLCVMTTGFAIQKQVQVPITQQQTPAVSGAYEVKLPDLEVQLKLIIGEHNYPDAGMCDTIKAEYTVTNIGDAPSGEYYISIRVKDAHNNWSEFSRKAMKSLGAWHKPGHKTTPGYVEHQLRRCPGDERHGFEVTVDPMNRIQEINENNNTVKKLHPSIGRLKKQPMKTRKLN